MTLVGFLRFAVTCFNVLAWPLCSLGYPLSLFWPYMKLFAICWLVMPHFDGSLYVYKHFVHPCVSVTPSVIYRFSAWKEYFLSKENFLVAAENGAEALEKLAANKVDKPEVNLSYTENKTYAAAEIKGATAAVALVVKDKVEENGPTKVMDHTDRSAPANGIEATILKKDSTPVTKSANSAVTNIAGQPPPLKKWAFQMSVHEDFLNLDDDGYTNGIASNLLAEETENLDTSLMASKFSFCETMKVERPLVSSEGKPPTNSINQNADVVIFKGTAFSEKSAVFAFPVAPATSMTIQPAVSSLGTNPEMIQVQPKETSNAPSIFNFSSKSVDKVSPVKYSSTSIVGSLDFNAGGSFSLSTGGGNKSNWKMVKVRRNPRKK